MGVTLQDGEWGKKMSFAEPVSREKPEVARAVFGVRPPAQEARKVMEHKKRSGGGTKKKAAAKQQGSLSFVEGNLVKKLDVENEPDSVSLSGVLETIRHYKEDSCWGIFLLRDAQDALHTVRGVLENARVGMDVTGFGQFIRDPKYGLQFDARLLTETMLEATAWDDPQRVFASLRSLPHLTEKRFARLWEAHGPRLREKMGEVQGILEVFPKLPRAHAENLVSAYLARGRFEPLYWFISRLGGGQGIIRYIIRHYDAVFEPGKWDVAAIVARYRQNPYRMLEVRGLGFLLVDAMALRSGMSPDSQVRMRNALRFVLAEKVLDQGDTAIPFSEWPEVALGKVVLNASEDEQPRFRKALQVAMDQLVADRKVSVWEGTEETGQPVRYVADRKIFQAEKQIVERLRSLSLSGSSPMLPLSLVEEVATRDGLSFLQRKALAEALRGRVGVLTGGPGTGKTTCMKSVLRAAARQGVSVALCAPTGKAASRLKLVAEMPASTIHSLIGKRPGCAAVHNRENPYPAQLFVVDEVSMVDTVLMADLLQALPDDACLLLVGDVWQLPSVGPGQVLSDLVRSRRFRVGILTENFRQREDPVAGQIPDAAHRVSSGILEGVLEPWAPGRKPDSFAGYHGYATDHEGDALDANVTAHELGEIVRHALARGVDPGDLQVLSPMRRHALGVEDLNRILQPILNASGMQGPGLALGKARNGVEPWTWRMGDRLILRRNYRDFQVFNGDAGTVVGLYPRWDRVPPVVAGHLGMTRDNFSPFVLVRFAVPMGEQDWLNVLESLPESQSLPARDAQGKPCVLMAFNRDSIGDLEPAYALTIHKTQGSEYPYVILVLHTQHWILCDRPLLYTGMTRAKKGLLVLGASKAVRQAARNPGNRRLTLLRHFLRHAS
ncbi:AAA family ATPase [Acidithiobacillus sp. IBUN Pt1247-S3]|uniref:AAA family ATPase n=1 Tax=Acidithiobacillus sp. IBUN Pt1247-S3 TaxID=3166642 RepID=UPI0034E3F8CE